MEQYVKAGRIIRLLGWLQLLGFIGMSIAIIIPFFTNNETGANPVILTPLFILVSIPILFFKVGTAIKEHMNWGRTAGIILGVLMLPSIPIGTILGAYVLWCLIKGWD